MMMGISNTHIDVLVFNPIFFLKGEIFGWTIYKKIEPFLVAKNDL